MSQNTNTAAAENLSDDEVKRLHMNAPHDVVNAMLASLGVAMPDAADLDVIEIVVDHSPLLNSIGEN